MIGVRDLSGDLDRLQKLAQDLAKSTEALKQWGNGEGDDLGVRAFLCWPDTHL